VISSNAFQVAAEFAAIDKAAFVAVRAATAQTADELRDTWRDNAQAHVRHPSRSGWYPKTIRVQPVPSLTAIAFDIYPDTEPGEGEGFEFGSRNQPPHLDGQRAKDALEPVFERRVDRAVGQAIR